MHETRESQKCTGSKHREPSMRTSNIELAGNVDPSTTTEQLRLRPPENPYNCSEFSSSHNEQSSTLVGCSDVQSWPASLNAEVRFWQPSFFDNDFSLDGFGTSNGRGRPALTLQTPNPNSPHIVEVDHSPAPTFAGSESTLIRIEDYGFGSNWLQHVKELPHVIQQIQDGHDYPRPKHRDERSTGLYDISVDSVLKQETEMSEHSHESELKGVGWHFGSFPLESDTIARANDLGHDLDQPDTYDIITDLATQLDIEQIRSKHSGDDFLPFDKLLTLLRHSDIERVLSQQFLGDAESVNRIAKDICHDNPKTSRRMILATLISIGKVDSIEIFIQKGIYDVNLPLRRYKVHGRRNMILFHRRNDSDDDPPLECLTHWTPHNLDDFCATQYKFIIPFFDMRQDSVHFYRMEDPRSRLPFLEWHIQRKGGYGTVWRAKIHPAHHNYKFKDADESFAVKEIHSTDVKGYEDEVRVLERFSGSQNGHPHLIRLLMAFQHGKQYYLIFPLAQGNLADLWDQKQMSPTSLLHTRWVIGQCLGMADGLKKIHRNYSWFKERNTDVNHLDVDKNRGRHGDIKPENILCFSNPEKTDLRLVISDFGLTRFHSAHSVSNVPPEKVGGLSVTYRPPEFDMKSSISQAYDMWSLGCLYLEFISWFLYGNQGTHENEDTRDKFHKARLSDDLSYDPRSAQDKFFNIYDGKAVLKESVKKWMADLRALDSCAPCIREFLNLIEDDLLQPNPGRRSKIDKFHVKLNRIWEKCKMPEYCVNGALSLEPRDSNFTGSVTGQLSSSTIGGQEMKNGSSAKLEQLILDEKDRLRAEKRVRSGLASDRQIGSSYKAEILSLGTVPPTIRRTLAAPAAVVDATIKNGIHEHSTDNLESSPDCPPSHLLIPRSLSPEMSNSTLFPSQVLTGESTSSQSTSLQKSTRNSTELLRVSQDAVSLEMSTRTASSSIPVRSETELYTTAVYPRQKSEDTQALEIPKSKTNSDPAVGFSNECRTDCENELLENHISGGSRQATKPTQYPTSRQQTGLVSSNTGTAAPPRGKRARIKEYLKKFRII